MRSPLPANVCRSIILSLGGRLQMASELGQGTTFSVILPTA
ncbi:MAG: hypothetical protein ACJ8AT_25140 [Hyalangium sp.]